jgi:hypothetical protein
MDKRIPSLKTNGGMRANSAQTFWSIQGHPASDTAGK